MQAYSPELVLDTIMNIHLGGLLDSEKSAQHTVVEIFLPHAHISVCHKLDADGPTPSSVDRQLHVSEIIVDSHRLHWYRNCHSAPQSTISISFEGLSLKTTVDSATPLPASSRNRGTSSNVFASNHRRVSIEYVGGQLDLACDLAVTKLEHDAPQVLVDVLQEFVREQRLLVDIYRKFRSNTALAKGEIISRVLMLTHGKAIIDPLSTIQPSYLVQRGRPYKLRTDLIFRFLFHLRNCLGHLRSSRCQLSDPPTFNDEIAALNLLQSRLSALALDVDRPKVPDLAFPGVSFPGVKKATRPSLSSFQAFRSLSLRARRIEVAITHPSGRSSSQIILTELLISASSRTLDLVPPPSLSQMTLSQVSLFNREKRIIRFLILSILVSDVEFVVLPQLMTFAQQALRVRRQSRYQSDGFQVACPATDHTDAPNTPERWNTHITSSIDNLKVCAAAENLTFEFQALGARFASTLFDSQSFALDSNTILLQARSTGKPTRPVDQDILASLTFTGVKSIAFVTQDPSSNMTIRASTATRDFRFNVPRSAIRLYRFIEEWRADYLPGIKETLHALLSEIRETPSPTIRHDSRRSPLFQLHGIVESLGIHLQVMHGTWLSWNVSRSVVYLRSSNNPPSQHNLRNFGLQSKSQLFSISPGRITLEDTTPSTSLKLTVPTVSLAGQYDGSRIETMALVDFFHLKIKPSHWDTLLVVQQKFGQDFNDLITLIAETRHQQRLPEPSTRIPSQNRWMLFASMKMRGFRVGLEGQTSIVYLECKDVRGGIDQDAIGTWHIQLSDLSLSLASRTILHTQDSHPNRNRLAFVVVDLGVSAEKPSSDIFHHDTLSISVTRFHAVLQPSSIRETGDFFNHMQVCGEAFNV